MGVVIDEKLNWDKKEKENLGSFMWEFHNTLVLFYQSLLQSFLMFNLLCTCTFGNLSQVNIKKLERPRKIAQRITRSDLLLVSILYEKHILLKSTILVVTPHTHCTFVCVTIGLEFARVSLRLPV